MSPQIPSQSGSSSQSGNSSQQFGSSSSSPQGGSSQQQSESRLSEMGTAFAAAASELTSIQTQIAAYQSTTSSGTPVTWAQLEALSQSVSRALASISTARSNVPSRVVA